VKESGRKDTEALNNSSIEGKTKCTKIIISQDNESTKKFINVDDIIFITRCGRKTVIHSKHEKVNTNLSLSLLEKKLKCHNFFRSHKGYIVNSNMVSQMVPWGKRTFLIVLMHTKETALITLEKANEFQHKYCL